METLLQRGPWMTARGGVMRKAVAATALALALLVPAAQAGPKINFRRVANKKFVFTVLVPATAMTFVAAEGASCLHDGPGGAIVRHPPCGRSVSYPIYFGVSAVNAVSIYKLKKYSDEDREAGLKPHWTSRYWWLWAQGWNVGVGGVGIRNLARPRR